MNYQKKEIKQIFAMVSRKEMTLCYIALVMDQTITSLYLLIKQLPKITHCNENTCTYNTAERTVENNKQFRDEKEHFSYHETHGLHLHTVQKDRSIYQTSMDCNKTSSLLTGPHASVPNQGHSISLIRCL
jgi:hypothetical protein